MSKVRNIISWTILIVVILFAGSITYVSIAPHFNLPCRYQLYYAESGSMKPTISIGGMVVIDKDASVKEGDIALYKSASGREVLHRIEKANADGSFVFKGDNNHSVDFSSVKADQIEGKEVLIMNWIAPVIRTTHHLSNV